MLLKVAVLLLAITSDVRGDERELERCYSNCDRSSKCTALERLPSKKVKRCLEFLYDRCEESNDPFKCLDSYRSTKKADCSKKILKNGIPCLKCEAKCDLDNSVGDDDILPFEGGSDQDTKCFEECDLSKECRAVASVSLRQLTDCDKYMSSMCGDFISDVDCLTRLKGLEDSRCPKAFRKNDLKCMKCENACAKTDPGTTEDAEEQCYDECSKTKSCSILDSASKQRLDSCKIITDANCPGNNDPVSCLKSIKNLRNPGCPREFRDHVMACTKCDKKCKEIGTSTDIFGSENGNEDCLAKCDSTLECMAVESASDARSEACEEFLTTFCGDLEDDPVCLDRLNGTFNASCPADFRNSLSACLKCDNECEPAIPEIAGLSPQMLDCIHECSNSSSCVAIENDSDEAVLRCQEALDRHCGRNNDTISCMEGYSNEDGSCPSALKVNVVDCLKCDLACERATPPTTMTKSKCETSCDSSLGCGGVTNACKDCTSAQCVSGDLTCLVTAIAVDCREACSTASESGNKKLCDDCKASCSKYP